MTEKQVTIFGSDFQFIQLKDSQGPLDFWIARKNGLTLGAPAPWDYWRRMATTASAIKKIEESRP